MIHFTMTGPQAGRPYCTSSKLNLPGDDVFYHLPYDSNVLQQLLDDQAICPKCKAIYELLQDDTLTDEQWSEACTKILKG